MSGILDFRNTYVLYKTTCLYKEKLLHEFLLKYNLFNDFFDIHKAYFGAEMDVLLFIDTLSSFTHHIYLYIRWTYTLNISFKNISKKLNYMQINSKR